MSHDKRVMIGAARDFGRLRFCARRLTAMLLFVTLTGCKFFSTAGSNLNIVGGHPALERDFDAVVGLTIRNPESGIDIIDCTGVMVHPRLVITAAHCVETWGEIVANAEQLKFVVGIYRGPGAVGGQVQAQWRAASAGILPEYHSARLGWADIAYLTLDQPVTGLSPLPIVASRSVLEAHARPGAAAILVGYGFQSEKMSPNAFGLKMTLVSQISKINGRAIEVGESKSLVGKGDSGGPLLFRLARGQLGVVGVLSHAVHEGETATTYATLEPALKWIETSSGIKPYTM